MGKEKRTALDMLSWVMQNIGYTLINKHLFIKHCARCLTRYLQNTVILSFDICSSCLENKTFLTSDLTGFIFLQFPISFLIKPSSGRCKSLMWLVFPYVGGDLQRNYFVTCYRFWDWARFRSQKTTLPLKLPNSPPQLAIKIQADRFPLQRPSSKPTRVLIAKINCAYK